MEVTTPPRCSTGVSCDFGGVTIQRSYPVVLCIRVSGYVLSLVLVGVLGDVAIRNAKKIRLLERFRFHSFLLTLSLGCQTHVFRDSKSVNIVLEVFQSA